MGVYRAGDRVSVAGLQGRVNYINVDRDLIDIIFDGREHATEYIPTSIVVKLASPLKVGDVIEGKQTYDALPVGAVASCSRYGDTIIRVGGGFIDARNPDRVYPLGGYFDPRTLVHLPGS